jgi:aromatic-L-amino-acid decarboxylase
MTNDAETPLSMSPDEFREYGHRLIDWLADFRARAAIAPVFPKVAEGDCARLVAEQPPELAEGFEAILRDLDTVIAPHLPHWQHPSYFAYFPSNGDLSAVLGDLLSTGLGVLGLNWQSAPALTELETRTTDWLRQLLGLSAEWSGVIQDTASTSSLVALLCARERASGLQALQQGLQSVERPLYVYTSADAHSSIDKAALLAGFGRERLRKIPVDTARAMDANALRKAIAEDVAAGGIPAAIVATTGTTATTAMDPIAACAEIAGECGAWLHVDAAMAGSAMILPECRRLWDGIEGADSLVLNPHKWLGVSFDCSTYYVRDVQHLVRVMSTNPSYLRTEHDGAAINYRDWGIALGRRFRALKLWALLRTHGAERLRARLRRDLDNARWLAEQVANEPRWRVLAPVALQTVCVRHEPEGLTGDALDRHTLGWLERVHATGRAWLTPAQLDGRWMVRISIGALATERADVEALWALLRESVG